MRKNIEEANAKTKERVDSKRRKKVFEVGEVVFDLKGTFSAGAYNKLKDSKYGPFHINQKINDNAYKVELPEDSKLQIYFNIIKIILFY